MIVLPRAIDILVSVLMAVKNGIVGVGKAVGEGLVVAAVEVLQFVGGAIALVFSIAFLVLYVAFWIFIIKMALSILGIHF